MWKTRNLSTFPSFPHKNVILFLSEGKVYTIPAKSKKNLYTFPAECTLFPLNLKRISYLPSSDNPCPGVWYAVMCKLRSSSCMGPLPESATLMWCSEGPLLLLYIKMECSKKLTFNQNWGIDWAVDWQVSWF